MLAVIATACVIYGCGEVKHTISNDPVLTYIRVSPSTAQVNVGASRTFTAIGYDQNVNVMSFTPSWTTSGGVGSINSSGVFTGEADGAGKVKAASGAVNGESTVTVIDTRVTSVVVSPDAATVRVGNSIYYNATGYDSTGLPHVITPTWSVSGGVGIIYSSGRLGVFTAQSVGAGAVSATYNSVSGRATVTVLSSTEVIF